MEHRQLGDTDIAVSALCLGTMMYGEQIAAADAEQQMDVCLDRGVTFFDTAELYTVPPKPETQGESERIVGAWMKQRGVRDKIVLATKVTGPSPMTWIRDGKKTDLSPGQIRTAVERSLRNLQTDYIDLYQTHWPDRNVQNFGADMEGYVHFSHRGASFEETLGVLGDLVKEGKIRHVGVSNETAWGVTSMLRCAANGDLPRIQSIQNAYSLLNRRFETGLAEIAIEEKVGLLAYSPMAQGVLSGKYLDGALPEGSRGALYGRLDRYKTASADEAIRAYVALGEQFNVDPAALALKFVDTRPFVTSTIFGARGMAQLDAAFAAFDLEWTEEMAKAVGKIHARLPNPCA